MLLLLLLVLLLLLPLLLLLLLLLRELRTVSKTSAFAAKLVNFHDQKPILQERVKVSGTQISKE